MSRPRPYGPSLQDARQPAAPALVGTVRAAVALHHDLCPFNNRLRDPQLLFELIKCQYYPMIILCTILLM